MWQGPGLTVLLPERLSCPGVENLPLSIGGVQMPPTARLHLHRIEGITYKPLDWVHLLDVPSGRGAVLANTLAFESPSQNTLEGCIHAYTPHSAKFPGVIVATGTEVHFNS